MALFGGGNSKTTSQMIRPEYIQQYIDQLNQQIGNTSSGDYVYRDNVGFNNNQTEALNNLAQSGALGTLSQQYMDAAGQGLGYLDNAYKGYQSLSGQGGVTGEQIGALAGQLYDDDAVQAAITANNEQVQQNLARNALPQLAQQYAGQHGSGARMAKSFAQGDALNQMQGQATDITNSAYNSAISQAESILSGNRQNQAAALSGLSNIGSNLSNLGQQGANLSQQQMLNQWNAGLQQQQQQQNEYDNAYQNAQNAANWGWQDINNQLGAAGVLNGALGQTTTTKQSGGSGGFLGGSMSGAAGGSSFGPWGALAGGVIGGLAST